MPAKRSAIRCTKRVSTSAATPEHAAELKELLETAGIDGGDLSRFRRYGSARKLYNFNIDHAGEY